MLLKDKVAIITGASDGLGKEVALGLGRVGVSLALIGRSKEKLEKVKSQIKKVKVEIYPVDIKNQSTVNVVFKKIFKDFGNINILLNIAGIWQKKMPVEEIDEEIINNVITTNLTALIQITRLAIPNLKKQKEGAIINVSSKSGVEVKAGQTVYSATKWGVRGFTEVLREDLRGTNIKVAGIYQSGVRTNMFFKTGETFPKGVHERFMNPKDLANIIVFMLSQPKNIWLDEIRVNYK